MVGWKCWYGKPLTSSVLKFQSDSPVYSGIVYQKNKTWDVLYFLEFPKSDDTDTF